MTTVYNAAEVFLIFQKVKVGPVILMSVYFFFFLM